MVQQQVRVALQLLYYVTCALVLINTPDKTTACTITLLTQLLSQRDKPKISYSVLMELKVSACMSINAYS